MYFFVTDGWHEVSRVNNCVLWFSCQGGQDIGYTTINHEKIHDNEVMVSFDIESLFTNVPIEGAVQAKLRKLQSDPDLPNRTNLTPTQIADLLNFILRSKYLQYTGSIYEQQDGAAMGSPVSVVIANIYMEEFEE